MKVPVLVNEYDFYRLHILLRCRSETGKSRERVFSFRYLSAGNKHQIIAWSGANWLKSFF
jgi:hypothetical protein